MEIWVDPQCSKCQAALGILDAEQAEYTVRDYLRRPPSVAELTGVLDRLGLEPWHITRFGEPVAAGIGIDDWPRDESSRQRWIEALSEHPVLIQRPIITADDGTAVIARSPASVQVALDNSTRTD